MTDIKEFPVDARNFINKNIYLAKEFLNSNNKIKIVANTRSASQAVRLAETLKRQGFVTFDDIQTETLVREGRQTRIAITVHKTADFDKLYKESLEKRKQREEERKKDEKKP